MRFPSYLDLIGQEFNGSKIKRIVWVNAHKAQVMLELEDGRIENISIEEGKEMLKKDGLRNQEVVQFVGIHGVSHEFVFECECGHKVFAAEFSPYRCSRCGQAITTVMQIDAIERGVKRED